MNKIDNILTELDSIGYSKIDGLLEKHEIFKARSLLKNHYDKINSNKKYIYPGAPTRNVSDKHVYNLQNKNKFFIDLLFKSILVEVGIKKLNDEYYNFLPPEKPNYTLLYLNGRSSGSKLDLHIDSMIPYRGKHTMIMQWLFMLDDFTIENGCTTIVPGSHQSGKYTDRKLRKLTPITGSAGDVVVWDSRIWHGAKENLADKNRWSIVATLGMWFLKPSMDIVRSMPQNIYQQLTNEQKGVMGFCSIPPIDELERNNTKCGYDYLKDNVDDYFFNLKK